MLEFVKKWTGVLLLASVVLGFLVPGLAIFKPTIVPLLMLLLYCSFVRMEFKLHNFFRKELLIYPLVCWVIFPAIVYYATAWMGSALQIGFLLAVITPPALGSPIMVSLAKGDLEFTVANVVIFNMLSPLVFATIPRLFIHHSQLTINYYDIFWRVTLVVFVPLLLAYFTNKLAPLKTFVVNKVDPYKGMIQMFLISIAVANSACQIRGMSGFNLVAIPVFTFTLVGMLYLIGWLIARNKTMKFTLPFTTGHKNTLLTITIALASFSEVTALPAVFYLIAHHTYNGIIISISRKRMRELKINN